LAYATYATSTHEGMHLGDHTIFNALALVSITLASTNNKLPDIMHKAHKKLQVIKKQQNQAVPPFQCQHNMQRRQPVVRQSELEF
jgi:hypothetical protein